MTDQNNAAAERSAHVERGPRRIPGESFLVEVSPGVFQIKAVAEALRERDAARVTLEAASDEIDKLLKARDEALSNLDAALAEAARVREALERIYRQPMVGSGVGASYADGHDVARLYAANIAHAALAAKEPGRRWRHVERGTEYAEVGRVTLQAATGPAAEGDTLVIYRGADGRLWAREAHEFEDGRFVPAKEPGRD